MLVRTSLKSNLGWGRNCQRKRKDKRQGEHVNALLFTSQKAGNQFRSFCLNCLVDLRGETKSKLNAQRIFWQCLSLASSFLSAEYSCGFWASEQRESRSRLNSPGESASGGTCREQGARPQPCLLDMPQILNLPVTTITIKTTKCRFTDCFQQHPFKFTYIYTRKIRVSATVTRDRDRDQ